MLDLILIPIGLLISIFSLLVVTDTERNLIPRFIFSLIFLLGGFIAFVSYEEVERNHQQSLKAEQTEVENRMKASLNVESIEIIKKKDYRTFIVKADGTYYEFYIDEDLITHRVIDVEEVNQE